MSMKENVKFVKDELNSEEKFIEGFVKAERFYKKYRVLIFALLAIIIVGTTAFLVNSYNNDQNKIKANIAFDKLLANPSDKEALVTLEKTNKQLYNIALYLQSKKDNKEANVNIIFFKELLMYQKALEKKNIGELNNLSMQKDFLLKEFALFNKALLLTEEGKYKEAQASLNLIQKDSKVYVLANLLKHHLITKL